VKYSLNPLSFSVEVSFDAKKASVEEIVKKLAEGGYPISGEPQILE
jgi:copper chaperone CopZ